MSTIRKFVVVPALPGRLEPLRTLAFNLWWCWSHDAISLFQRLEPDLWESSLHNPVRVLGSIRQERLEEVAHDEGFLSHMQRVAQQLERYKKASTWYERHYGDDPLNIAYFSAEYGLTESLAIYSGGLGILAGDHIKSSSDLGLPLVGVGLLYRVGYFQQYLNVDGWQQERFPENDFFNLPLKLVRGEAGAPITVPVELAGRTVVAQVWHLAVGRVPIYLLDTNLEQNSLADREITAQLYGGDTEMRMQQEILLGIGGQRLLALLGIEPTVCHMNEGHSAFQALERIRRVMLRTGASFTEARLTTSAGNVFTTHTPVPAGNDMFAAELVDKYLRDYWPKLGLDRDGFLGLGRIDPRDTAEPFCMTVLALRCAAYSNGVSRLHGEVSRKMWAGIWPGLPEDEVPIASVTNGVHTMSWISGDMVELFDRYLGPRWRDFDTGAAAWERVAAIPDEELWRIHERQRARLVNFARRRLAAQLQRRGEPLAEVEHAREVLDPEALTIGFARRFATYKRAYLLFRDLERLKRIVGDHDRPVQVVIAGKAHPRDAAGKELIRQVIHHARDPLLRRRIVFLEDYGMHVARRLVRGCDVWLNTPRRPMEASGTSGMKVPPNGGINMSILDGWWPEAVEAHNGWAIGHGEVYEDHQMQDEVESHAIYDLLEKEVVPLFYDRGRDGLPRGWIARMKGSIRTVCPAFNTDRMVADYMQRFYHPASRRMLRLSGDNLRRARDLAEWLGRLRAHWAEISIRQVRPDTVGELEVGAALRVTAVVHLGTLTPEEVAVQLYHGPLDGQGRIKKGSAITMGYLESLGEGEHLYAGAIPCRMSGQHGHSLRVLPAHADLVHPYFPAMIHWG